MKIPIALPSAEGTTADVVGLGENSVDLLAVVDGHPAPDTKQPLESLTPMVGGQIASALVACARLGWRAHYIGAVGDDAEGEAVAAQLARERVAARLVKRSGCRTRSAVILADRRTGARTVLEHRDRRLSLDRSELDLDAIRRARVLLVDGTDPAASIAAALAARAAGVATVLDADRMSASLEPLFRAVDVVIVAAAVLSVGAPTASPGEALVRLQAQFGAAVVIVTLGPEGCLARCGGREFRSPAFDVDVVDGTGAGDAFRGGFVSGWLAAGDGADLHTLIQYANAVAGLNCRALGAQAGLPGPAEVASLLGSCNGTHTGGV